MTVQSVNNHDNRNRYLGLTIGGLVVGGAAGGIYGDNTKPWVKNGELTDTFIRNVDKAYVEENKKQFTVVANDLKKISESGSLNGISDFSKKMLKKEELDLDNLDNDGLKNLAKDLLEIAYEESGTTSFDELIKSRHKAIYESSFEGLMDEARKIKSLNINESMPEYQLKKVLIENAELLSVVPENGKTLEGYVDTLVKQKDIVINGIKKYQSGLEALAAEQFNEVKSNSRLFFTDKFKLKELGSNASPNEIINFNAVKNVVQKMSKAVGVKCAVVGGSVLGLACLATGYFLRTDKK